MDLARLRMCAAALAAAMAGAALTACTQPRTLLTQQVEAHRLASDLHVQYARAAEASNRAVMSETDEGSAAAVAEARRHRQAVEADVEALRGILQSLDYQEELRNLGAFNTCFEQYRRLDDEILPLSVENTNVKAQQLSFGPSREAAGAFRSALDKAVATAGNDGHCRSAALASRAMNALLRIEVLQAPHIAAADLTAMTRMEEEMNALEADARTALRELRPTLPAPATPRLEEAAAALDRFHQINAELIALSRRNTNVRSLALSLGEKRVVTARCEDQLRAIEELLAKHRFTATR